MPSAHPNMYLVDPTGKTPGPADDALMVLAAGGDSRSFAVLVERHQSAVRRLSELLLRDSAQARDVAQLTFLRLWEQRNRYRPQGQFRELMFTITRNESRRVLRKRAFLSLFGLAPEVEVQRVEAGPADIHESNQRQFLIRTALERLPEKFRVPLELRFVEGLSHEEIARVIGRTVSATRSRVHYGLKALAELLPEDLTP